jgi:hypothetical protein
VRTGKLNEFRVMKNNPNKHTERGLAALEASIAEVGYVAPVTVAADGEAIDGSARLDKVSAVLGDEALVIEHDGTRPVVMVRTDIPNAQDPKARKTAYLSNRVTEIDLAWDAAQIAADLEAGLALDDVFTDVDLRQILSAAVYGNTSIDREGQNVASIWDFVHTKRDSTHVILGTMETHLPSDIVLSVVSFCEKQWDRESTPIPETLANILIAGLRDVESVAD